VQDLTHLDRPAPHTRIERSLMDEPVAVLKPARAVGLPPTATVAQAISTMIEKNVGALLIVDASDHIVGIFSERDLLSQVGDDDAAFSAKPVGAFMTPDPEAVSIHDKLCFALHKMDVGGYRHLPVTDGNKPAGMISVRDFLRYIRMQCKDS
jgi:CBS domain-containing protein